MRRISAAYVYPLSTLPVKYGIISIEQEGIIDMDTMGFLPKESSSLEYFNGILTPGFINLNLKYHDISVFSSQVRRMIYEKGVRALVFSQLIKNHEYDLMVQDILKNEHTSAPYRVKSKLIAGPEAVPDLLNSRIHFEWVIFSKETLVLILQNSLAAFFRKHIDKIIFTWDPVKPFELCRMFNYFLETGISFKEVLLPVTINPAKMIGQKGLLGEIKADIRPGINLLGGIDFRNQLFREKDFAIKRIA